jgi:hypothetical protein
VEDLSNKYMRRALVAALMPKACSRNSVVAIVDTGVWYYHPALGGGFGPGFKVAGGYDLVGNACKSNWPSINRCALLAGTD